MFINSKSLFSSFYTRPLHRQNTKNLFHRETPRCGRIRQDLSRTRSIENVNYFFVFVFLILILFISKINFTRRDREDQMRAMKVMRFEDVDVIKPNSLTRLDHENVAKYHDHFKVNLNQSYNSSSYHHSSSSDLFCVFTEFFQVFFFSI